MGEVLPAPETCLGPTDDDEDCDGSQCARFSVAYGDNGTQIARGVAVDAPGNIYIVGENTGKVTFGADIVSSIGGGQDAFVARLDATGVASWALGFGGPQAELASDVLYDPGDDSVIVAGVFAGTIDLTEPLVSAGYDDVFVAKLYDDGTPASSVSLGGPSVETIGGLALVDGKYVIAGGFSGSILVPELTNAGNYDAYVVAFHNQLGLEFADEFGGPEWNEVQALSAAPGNTVNLGGRTSGSMDMGQDTLTLGGGGSVGFVTTYADGDDYSAAVPGTSMKVGADGASGQRAVYAVAANIMSKVIAGQYNAALDLGGGPLPLISAEEVFVASYGQNSNAYEWGHALVGAGDQRVGALAMDSSGRVILVGWFEQTVEIEGFGQFSSVGGTDILMVLFSADGEIQWARAFGGAGNDQALAVAWDGADAVVVGSFEASVDFGAGAMVANNQTDVFVAKFAF